MNTNTASMISKSPIYHFYCPSNLDLPALLNDAGEAIWLEELWRLYYIITVLYRKRWGNEYDPTHYFELNSAILQKVIHCKWTKRALDVLLRLAVIETDGCYRRAVMGVRGKSMGFRIAEPYDSSKFREVKELDCSKISKRLILAQNKHLAALTPQQEYLFGCLKRVTILESAREFQESNSLLMSQREKDYYDRSLEWIETAQWMLSVGPKGGRVFTNITSLPRELRPFLRLGGRPMVEIDVSACQPLLLSQLYKPDENEKALYLDVVLSGQFYETLDNRLEKPYGEDKRDELKKAVYIQVFFDRLREVKLPLCQAFSDMFPVLYSEIVKFKRQDYRKLSHKLQRDESEIVINIIVKRIMETSRIPVVTIHDCIMTLPEYAPEVEKLFKETFAEKLGVQAKVKHTDHTENWANRDELTVRRQAVPMKEYTAEQKAEINEMMREMMAEEENQEMAIQ